MFAPLISILTLSFILGIRHAADADHVAAVTTLITRQKKGLKASALIGILWAAGHSLTVTLVGIPIILFNIVIPTRFEIILEFFVGIMLVILGLFSLLGLRAHKHIHNHTQNNPHSHIHLHLPGLLNSKLHHLEIPQTFRPLLIGLIHGLAGSAAIAILILSTIQKPIIALFYLLIFHIGVLAGMVTITLLIGTSVGLIQKRSAALNHYLILASGFFSLLFGLYIMYQTVMAPPPSTSTKANSFSYNFDVFAENLGGVRDLEFSPGGTLLASITSDGKVIALTNNNNQAGQIQDVILKLKKPHGIAFFNNKLFIAEEDKVVRFNWDEQTLQASLDKVLFDLPLGGNHFTRSIVFDSSGRLYVSIGSTCNVCNEEDPRYAAVLVSDQDGTEPKLFAKGLRNSVFMTLNLKTGDIWATDMGRDFLGDNLPPEEINILKADKNYGWPNCYGQKIPDTDFNPNANCQNTEPPVYEFQAHSAPLGLNFINSPQFPEDWQGDLLVAYHGSWNRSEPTGYKVVKLNVENNKITGGEDFLTNFIKNSEVLGRPVDLIFDKKGNLFISDDKAGAIYIVTAPL